MSNTLKPLKPFIIGTSNDKYYKHYRKPATEFVLYVSTLSAGHGDRSELAGYTEITLRNVKDGSTFDILLSPEDVELLVYQLTRR